MRVGLVQADGKLPNLALMQISAYHENQGHQVEWWQGPLFNETYDQVYVSKIFKFSTLPEGLPDTAKIGGTGIDWTNKLPDEMYNLPPSYSLYPDCDYHLGFSMKGCRFACKFCVVPKKEGRPFHNSTISQLLINKKGGDRLMLLDNDFFGSPNWEGDITEIIRRKLKVCFVQGLNIRIITAEQAELLAMTRYYNSSFKKRYLTFAWDKYRDERIVMRGMDICEKAGIPARNMQFFVLIGFDTTPEQDMERVQKLFSRGALPYVMAYDRTDPYQRDFQRWVNHRAIFKTVPWEEYQGSRVSVIIN